MEAHTYTLGEGDKASARLDLQHSIIGIDFKNHLLEADIKQAKIVLEIGCGNGEMAFWCASQLSPQGKIIAVDKSQKHIDIARKRAKALGITTIDFLCCDIQDLELPLNSVDIIYCRFVLMHLQQPVKIIEKLTTFLKKGGIFAAQEPINSYMSLHPQNSEFLADTIKLISNVALQHGVDYDIGKRIYELFCQAGLHHVHLHFSQRVVSVEIMKSLLLQFYEDISPAAIRAGVISKEDLSKHMQLIQMHFEKENEYFVLPQQAHVTGYKA